MTTGMKYLLLKTTHLFIAFLAMCLLHSCEVDFSPNGEWKETPVIYALFDQDADTTFIRVEKCFLGEGNLLHFAKNKDSVYYAPENLQVEVLSYAANDPNTVSETFPCNYQWHASAGNDFFYEGRRPIYYFISKNKLSTDRTYKVVVRNLQSGHEAKARLTLIKDYRILAPGRDMLQFDEGKRTNKYLTLKWNVQESTQSKGALAKTFQPVIRLHFIEDVTGNGDWQLAHCDMIMPTIRRENTSDQTYTITEKSFLSVMGKQLQQRKTKKQFRDQGQVQAEFIIRACDHSMTTFIDLNKPSEGLASERPQYTNVENGMGLVAARRMYVSKSLYKIHSDVIVNLRTMNVGF